MDVYHKTRAMQVRSKCVGNSVLPTTRPWTTHRTITVTLLFHLRISHDPYHLRTATRVVQLAPMPASLASFTYFFVFVWVYTACPVIAVKELHGTQASAGSPHPQPAPPPIEHGGCRAAAERLQSGCRAAAGRLHAEPACHHLPAGASVALRACKLSAHRGGRRMGMARRCSKPIRVYLTPMADNQVSANMVGTALAFALSFITTMFYFGLYEAGKLMESPVATTARLIPLDTLSFALSVSRHPNPGPDPNLTLTLTLALTLGLALALALTLAPTSTPTLPRTTPIRTTSPTSRTIPTSPSLSSSRPGPTPAPNEMSAARPPTPPDHSRRRAQPPKTTHTHTPTHPHTHTPTHTQSSQPHAPVRARARTRGHAYARILPQHTHIKRSELLS